MRSVASDLPVSVLFTCVDNAALSLMAESILRSLGNRRFRAASAALQPAAAANPLVMEFLQSRSMPIEGLRPKKLRDSPQRFDFVIRLCARSAADATLCAGEGAVIADWNLEALRAQFDDPPHAQNAIRDAFWILMRRIKIFASLPHHAVPRRSSQYRVEGIAAWN